MRRHRWPTAIGYFRTEYWPSKQVLDERGQYRWAFDPPKPLYRNALVTQKTGEEPHPDPYYSSRGHVTSTWTRVDNLIDKSLTLKNSSPAARVEQAKTLVDEGYRGPVSGGEACVLRRLFTELGRPELVKHGWIHKEIEVMASPTHWAQRQARWTNTTAPKRKIKTMRLQHCYVFKSPLDNVPFEKFIKLARMYKDDSKKLCEAVKAVLDNPEAHNEVEALDTLDILAKMGGSE